MKKFLLLFLLSAPICSQNLYTNEPDLVYPVLEEFIAENFKRDTRTMHRINNIDSIVVRDLPLIVEDHLIKKVYGLHHQRGSSHWIELDSSLLDNHQKFQKTLKHELGHVFGLPHIIPAKGTPYSDPIYNEIMCLPSLPYYIEPEAFRIAKENFYKSLSPKK